MADILNIKAGRSLIVPALSVEPVLFSYYAIRKYLIGSRKYALGEHKDPSSNEIHISDGKAWYHMRCGRPFPTHVVGLLAMLVPISYPCRWSFRMRPSTTRKRSKESSSSSSVARTPLDLGLPVLVGYLRDCVLHEQERGGD
mmetsp:Transcript_3636/g.8258  ORF Transcript_3636/g.8258 Transcript_3636/m.8258 type:complete len:142 (+) Transcript_3636:1478-1903(+)